jgi:phosphoribosylformylglycinamidine synthase
MIIDGQSLAQAKINKLTDVVRRLRAQGLRPPRLVTLVASQDSAGLLYSRLKRQTAKAVGIEFTKVLFSLTDKDGLAQLVSLSDRNFHPDGLMIQKPGQAVVNRYFPSKKEFEIWWLTATSRIPEKKDVDCLNVANLGLLAAGLIQYYPATVKAVWNILQSVFPNGNLNGKEILVIGSSEILGKPLSMFLRNKGASVTLIGASAANLAVLTKKAAIIISSVGLPNLINGQMVTKGAVIIDCGIVKKGKKVVGDVDFQSVAKKASFITPVPGGVGPVTVACLMENVVKAYRRDIGAKALSIVKKSILSTPKPTTKSVGSKQLSVNRIFVGYQTIDARAATLSKQLQSLINGQSLDLTLINVYTIDKNLSGEDLHQVTDSLTNPVIQKNWINNLSFLPTKGWVVEVGFLPGVTDNVANTTRQIIEDLLKKPFISTESVYTSQLIIIPQSIPQKEIDKIRSYLGNPLIQRVKAFTIDDYRHQPVVVPRVRLKQSQTVNNIDLVLSDEDLTAIGKQGIANTDASRRGPLALDLTDMRAIRRYFHKANRLPTDIELESIAQTWSEHCKHTIFADPIDNIKDGLFKHYIQRATEKIRRSKATKDFCLSVFQDNSGAIIFDEQYLITDKVETHNSPSALDPFGGAITGIVGVNRDTIGFGLGAKPVINRYGYCFADPQDQTILYKGPNCTQPMLTSRQILDGVVKGVNSGGNCSGIPTPTGFCFFDRSYKGKPLVFVGTVGLMPRYRSDKSLYIKKAQKGDLIVMVGGRVGKDGIHGATFSSEAMDSASPATAVQIGDPITQKKMSDALVKEARDRRLFHSITDNGAGGLSCSVAEMAKECNGCVVELDKVPLKYSGLAPWEIWISESQERMTLAVSPESWPALSRLMKRRGVEATVIGRFTDSGHCLVKHQGKTIMDIEMDFLHHGLPPRHRQSVFHQQVYSDPDIPKDLDLNQVFIDLLKRPNLASFEYISRQYDHEVQGGSVIKPLQGKGRINGEAAVIRPLLTSNKGVVVSQALYPRYSLIDTYRMAACSLDTAIRNCLAAGASLDKIALLDNFCWCSSEEPERLGQLKRAVKACYDYAVAYGTPFISGKDSMFNDFKGYDQNNNPLKISVLPTLLISSLAVVEDIYRCLSLDLKSSGDQIFLLGETRKELAASEYYAYWCEKNHQNHWGSILPEVQGVRNRRLYKVFDCCLKEGLIASAHSLGWGGLGISLVKSAMAGGLGVKVKLGQVTSFDLKPDQVLFSESQGRLLVSVAPSKVSRFARLMTGQSYSCIGEVTAISQLIIRDKQGKKIVDLPIKQLLNAYRSTFINY